MVQKMGKYVIWVKSQLHAHVWLRRTLWSLLSLMMVYFLWKMAASLLGWNQPSYKTVAIEEGPLVVSISASGTLNPVKSVQVGTQVSGMIQEIYVDFNAKVKKGQVIARIDPREWQARFDQADANYILAKRNHDNNQRLIEKNFVSPAAFDQTLSAYKSAKAALTMAKKALDDTVIKAPVDGVVVKRSVEPGQTVAASLQAPELFIIAQDLADMQVETSIDESDVGRITEGMSATFTVDAFPGKVFKSQVKQIRKSPINVQNVVTYTVLLTAQNPDLKLLPGMTANATIVTEQKESVLRLPNAALRFRMPMAEGAKNADGKSARPATSSTSGAPGSNAADGSGGKPYSAGAAASGRLRKVWVMDGQGLAKKPMQKTVRVGLSDGSATELLPVKEGSDSEQSLKAGDLVIIGVQGGAGAPGSNSMKPPPGPRLF
ncbi:efflux RND transporter periplasmic adaptor subunit [Polynucleobacter sp. MWH-Spelu-300-X4]|uniref:efflux RND transporter periplasmic adaptor subunit n=1 Tax=Polynucleobacter sp. MWH-Spelu-300-X4 TaxID=2689109 RepID=UPI001BFD3744|nr:efflux RND transporter periplasmic adaptor subunit [Polynucleobacter sp. MWH-Spelu-300-X4]QWD80075.1 efflux RND transporter periplasmic adaptor subunit [Polynucleobacter sp. MWH-Spelu-300-X4]